MNHLRVDAFIAVFGVLAAGAAFAQNQGADGGRRGGIRRAQGSPVEAARGWSFAA